MNDNLPIHAAWRRDRPGSQQAWLEQVQDVRNIGIRALARPESLSMGEIQDIAWGFLMAARTLERMAFPRTERP